MKTPLPVVKKFIYVFFFISVLSVFGQQESQFTQYMYNTITINPAYAGSRGLLSVTGLYRSQWVGVEGAPEVLNFSLHTPLGLGGLGGGLTFISDRIGPAVENSITADLSYTIKTSSVLKLSFGFKTGSTILDIDEDKLSSKDLGDEKLQGLNQSSFLLGTGVYLHTEKWYVGFSTPNFLDTERYDDIETTTFSENTQYYIMGGYVFSLSPELKLKPAFLMRSASGDPLVVDITANALLKERLTFGIGYRFDAAISSLVAFNVRKNLLIGYAYDYNTNDLGNYNAGSHEIFLRFELEAHKLKVNPRFF